MKKQPENSNDLQETKNRGGKYLSFFLKDEEYGIEILKVQEIIGMLPVTRVPRTPEFVRGVVNLRGKIIPVTDLRRKFGMEEGEMTAENCIIVVQTRGLEIGVIVDKVSEVLDIPETEIEDVPAFGTEINTDYLLGVGKTGDKVRLLLDIDEIVTEQDLTANSGVSEEVAVAV